MRVNRTLFTLALASILIWGLGAQDQPVKFGIVDIEQAISSTDAGKAAREELARKQRDAEARIQPLIESYKEAENDLKAKKFVLSDDALYNRQLDLVELRNRIETKMKELESQLKIDEKRLQGPLLAKLGEIIESIGKDSGFTMILRRGSPGVLYARESLDVTDLVIENYNKKR